MHVQEMTSAITIISGKIYDIFNSRKWRCGWLLLTGSGVTRTHCAVKTSDCEGGGEGSGAMLPQENFDIYMLWDCFWDCVYIYYTNLFEAILCLLHTRSGHSELCLLAWICFVHLMLFSVGTHRVFVADTEHKISRLLRSMAIHIQ